MEREFRRGGRQGVGYSPSSSPPKNMPPSSTPIRMDSIVPKGRRGGTSGT